jgi:CRISPR-associated protein Csb1
MTITELAEHVAKDAALRRRQHLQPVGGKGDKIFPPTYPGEGRNNPPPRHVFERRQLGGREAWCVLVDSVQSQANRLEESLLRLIADGVANIPHVVVDFSRTGLAGISKITSLDVVHGLLFHIVEE